MCLPALVAQSKPAIAVDLPVQQAFGRAGEYHKRIQFRLGDPALQSGVVNAIVLIQTVDFVALGDRPALALFVFQWVAGAEDDAGQWRVIASISANFVTGGEGDLYVPVFDAYDDAKAKLEFGVIQSSLAR